jgi:hypothetical protein
MSSQKFDEKCTLVRSALSRPAIGRVFELSSDQRIGGRSKAIRLTVHHCDGGLVYKASSKWVAKTATRH